jgi:fructokinase
VLWDVIGEQEYLGGAPLNFSFSSQRLGHKVALISAVGDDRRGERALRTIQKLGLDTDSIRIVEGLATGAAMVSTDHAGNATFVIDRPAAFDFIEIEGPTLRRIEEMRPDWIYFGTLAQTTARNVDMLHRLISAITEAQRFYDINLREGHWNLPLVQQLSRLASIIKLNESEAEVLFRIVYPDELFSVEKFCENWSRDVGAKTICVTLGERGCALWVDGAFRTYSGFLASVRDTVGAGDAFSAALLHGLELGWSTEGTASFANAVGAVVASRAGATPDWTVDECLSLADPQM